MAGTSVNYQLITSASEITPLHMTLNNLVYDSVYNSVYNSVQISLYTKINFPINNSLNSTVRENDWD
jgi:hypothetical protein